MNFSIRNFFKPILGLFVMGLALWFNPIDVHAYVSYGVTPYIPNGTSLPFNYTIQFPDQLGTLNPSFVSSGQYNNLQLEVPAGLSVDSEYTFELCFSVNFFNSFYNIQCEGPLVLTYSLNYQDSDGVHTMYIGNTIHSLHFDNDSPFPSINDVIPVYCPGIPLSYNVVFESSAPGYSYLPWVFSVSPSYNGTALPDTSSGTQTFTITGYSDPVGSSRILLVGQNGQGTFDGNFSNRMSNITLTGSIPFNSPDYDLSFHEEDIDPSGSRFCFGIVSSVRDFHISFGKKIADQFEEYFDYQPPNTQSFNTDKSSVDSSINTVTNFQNTAFSGLSSAVNDTGLDTFDFAEYGPQMSYVGLLLTSVYNIFPNKFKYVIYFVLFVGFFGVLLNAGTYIKKMRDNE